MSCHMSSLSSPISHLPSLPSLSSSSAAQPLCSVPKCLATKLSIHLSLCQMQLPAEKLLSRNYAKFGCKYFLIKSICTSIAHARANWPHGLLNVKNTPHWFSQMGDGRCAVSGEWTLQKELASTKFIWQKFFCVLFFFSSSIFYLFAEHSFEQSMKNSKNMPHSHSFIFIYWHVEHTPRCVPMTRLCNCQAINERFPRNMQSHI